ncbi:hypothetical protein D9M68_554840 [compost metagenome]
MTGTLASYSGLQIVPSPLLTEKKEVHRRPRKWAHRLMWQRNREFAITYADVPSRQILKIDGKLFMHPALIAELERRLLEQQP